MKKRLFSILLAALMIVSLLPTMAFAKEADCTHTQKVTTITNGETYQLNLSGKNKGDFTFEASGRNWNIKNSDGKYLNAANGKLVLGSTAQTAWTYSNGAFSTAVKTTQKNTGYWWGWIYIPGHGSKTVTTTYYLNTVTNGKLSTNYVCAELFKTVSGEHDYGKAIYVDQTNHKYVCKNCGDVKTEAHSYDETTHKCVCGAFDPAESSVKISVDVKEKTSKQYVGWWFWGTWKDVTTYTATIKTEAKGVKVTKVQYQLNGGRWTNGTCVSSDKPIESLKVKAWDNNGKLYEYAWQEAPAPVLTPVDAPAATTGLVYNGTEQIGVAEATGYTVANGKATDAGSYTATAMLAEGYKWSDGTTTAKQIEWSVAKAELTATVDDKSVTVGDEAPEYTVTYTGWVNGESIEMVTPTTAAVLACDYTATSAAGEYDITFATEPVFANYSVTTVPGKLTVAAPAAPTEYTVTFNLNGITGTAPEVQTIKDGEKVTKPADPTFADHTLEGWYKTKDATTGALSDPWDFDNGTVTADMTLYAQWTRTMKDLLGSDFPKNTQDNSAPENAWTNANGYKAFIYSSDKFFKLDPGNANGLALLTSNEFTRISDDKYVFEYVNGSTSYGVFTLNIEDSTLVSIEYDGAGTSYAVLSGTYAPASNESPNLTIGEKQKLTDGVYKLVGGTYGNLTIPESIGNGDVTLDGVTITGKLIVEGGGSNSVHLDSCDVKTIEVNKDVSGEDAETPRIDLVNTSIENIVAEKPVIIEADKDSAVEQVEAKNDVTVQGAATEVKKVTVPESAASTGVELKIEGAKVAEVVAEKPVTIEATNGASPIEKVEAKDNVTVKGANIETVTVPENVATKPEITVTTGTVNTVEAKSEVKVEGDGTVSNVKAEAPVEVNSATVTTITVTVQATVTVTGNQPVEVAVETTDAVSVVTENTNVSFSTTLNEEINVVTKETESSEGTKVAHVHKWVEDTTQYVAPTCSATGTRVYVCGGVGDCDVTARTKTETLPKLPHTEQMHKEETIPGKAATCEETGLTDGVKCSVSNTVLVAQTEIPALGHDWATEWSKDETYHWHVCQREGCDAKGNAAAHNPGAAATESSAQTCTVCGYVITPALGHVCKNHLTAHEAVAATCTTAGNSAYWSCTCGKFYSDANAENEIAENSWVISALGHNLTKTDAKSATCEEGGNNAYWTCSRCHKVYSDAEGAIETTVEAQTLAATGHNYGAATYEWTAVNGGYTCTGKRVCANNETHVDEATAAVTSAVTKAATCTEKGETTYTATFTKEGFETQTKTGNDFLHALIPWPVIVRIRINKKS